jgi:muramoyltetrapeptide carboxypeptidase
MVATHVPRKELIHDQPRTNDAVDLASASDGDAAASARPSRRRPLVGAGARVALVAPAGPLRGASELDRALENVRSFGWEPVVAPHALARDGYFAGSDAQRSADLNAALADDSIDAVWCLRGGYGTMRILESLDYDAVARRAKAIIGYSDITALHAALRTRCGVTSFHGPTARAHLSAFSRASLHRAVVEGCDPCGDAPGARVLRGGRADGVLAGGNLALLSALVGTPFAAHLDGAILVLEDIDEAVYRIDRMLQQLLLARQLDGVRAIAFGACTNCPEAADDGARRLDDVVAELADRLGVPAIAGLPVGHIDDQWTLPLGAFATLDADRRSLTVRSYPTAD